VDRGIQNTVELSGNVNSGTNENPISANQLENFSATLMAAMQAANAKLAWTSESKLNKTREESNKQTDCAERRTTSVLKVELNKISENLDAKLASVSESLGTRLISVSDSLNRKPNSMIANVTSER
jgi:hypothetical protein